MSPGRTVKTEDLEAELVIIGGGGAGLAAATAAAEKGATKVVVLEKMGLGGNSALATGLFAAESPAQRRAAIDAPRDVIFKQAMDYAHWKSNPRIVRAFIDKSGDTIQWLEDKGLHFELVALYFNQSPLVWHVPDGRLGLGRAAQITKALAAECRKMGVQLLTRTPAKKILTSANGEIVGVMAKAKGKELNINTKCVIIATGGYAGNKDLLKKYYPYYQDNMNYRGVAQNIGDGLLMAIEVGAATEGLGLLLGGGPGGPPPAPPIKIGSPPNTFEVPLMAIMREPYMVYVNEKAERFVDESTTVEHRSTSSDAIKASYVLFDHGMVRHLEEHGVITGAGLYRPQQRGKIPGLAKELRTQADKGFFKIADTWDEIAEYIGVKPKALKATIDKYNADCDQGHDSFLIKDPRYLISLRTPPYYAMGGTKRSMLDTIGGIKINEHMEVLDNEDNPISGLYAAGVATGGWQAVSYNGYHTSGAACGFAINSGRIAGENALEFTMRLK